MLSWTCPACGGRLSAPDRLTGRTAPCVHCRAPVTVPAPNAAGVRHVPDAPPVTPAPPAPPTAAGPVPATAPSVPPATTAPAALRSVTGQPATDLPPRATATPTTQPVRGGAAAAAPRAEPPPRGFHGPLGKAGLAAVLVAAGLGYTTWSRMASRPQPPAEPVVDAVVAPPLQPAGAPVPPAPPGGGLSREQLEAAGLVDNARWQEHQARNQLLPADRAVRHTVAADGTVRGPADPASRPPAADPPSAPAADAFDADSVPPTADDYRTLATMASQFVRRDGRLVRLDPDAAALERLRASKSLRARELGRRAEEALGDYVRADIANKQAARQEEAALGGFLGSVFSGDSDTLVASEMEMPGMMRIESLSSHYASQALAAGVAAVQGRFTATELFDRADEARLALWEELAPQAARHAGATVADTPPVRVEIVRTAQTEFDGVFEFLRESLRGKTLHVYGVRATNESGRDLSNVTLRLTLEAVPSAAVGRQPGLPDAALADPNHYFLA